MRSSKKPAETNEVEETIQTNAKHAQCAYAPEHDAESTKKCSLSSGPAQIQHTTGHGRLFTVWDILEKRDNE